MGSGLRPVTAALPKAASPPKAVLAPGTTENHCGQIESNVDYVVKNGWATHMDHIPDQDKCCTECHKEPKCRAWTWVADAGLPKGDPGQCWLKGGTPIERHKKVGVVSGLRDAAVPRTKAAPMSKNSSASGTMLAKETQEKVKPMIPKKCGPTEKNIGYEVVDVWGAVKKHVTNPDICCRECQNAAKCLS